MTAWALRCSECSDMTTDPVWCDHGRIQCPGCLESSEGCNACARETLDERRPA